MENTNKSENVEESTTKETTTKEQQILERKLELIRNFTIEDIF